MASEYLNQMERFQKKLHKKVRDVEKKKDEIRGMYQESLEDNLKVINNLKTIVMQKIAELGGAAPNASVDGGGILSGQGFTQVD